MKIFFYIFWFAVILSAPTYCVVIADSIPPSCSWISPSPFSVITTNSIRLAVNAQDDSTGSGIEKATFYARYTDLKGKRIKKTIGEVYKYPYEIIWDCSSIPDQSVSKLKLYCTVTDRAGNLSDKKPLEQRLCPKIVLDRNPGFSSVQLSSYRARKDIILDGNLKEWDSGKGITFINNDNTITYYSLWNDTQLFFAARVKDNSIISTISPKSEILLGMPQEDVIEVFLDVDHDHSVFSVLPDRHFLFSAGGKVYETFTRRDLEHNELSNAFPRVSLVSRVDGTLNVETDKDTGYTIEASVSWKELGITPRKGRSIGLEVWNTDRDYLGGTGTFAGWTTNAANLKNSSEWGNLVLVEETSFFRYAMLLPLLILLGASATLLFFQKRRKVKHNETQEEMSPPEEPEEKACIRKAKEYTLHHYSDEKLDRESVAAHVGLHPTYFGQVFKKETKVHYSEYLAEFRIEKAKELLHTTNKNVAEVAYETGFSSQSYFCTVFKRKTGFTPKQYLNQKR